jgi:hypothetical protein
LIPREDCHPERSLAHRERRIRRTCGLLIAPLLFGPFCLCSIPAQTASPHAFTATTAASASARTFHDPTYHLSFDYPAGWTFAHADGEISTFRLDARSAVRKTLMRAVVAMPENPFPESTFSGAYVYFSVTPRISEAACAAQAQSTNFVRNVPHVKPGEPTQIAGIPFIHGHDEQRDICITQRDELYTTRRRGVCYRFDLAINNFCGGEVSGVKDITAEELDQVRARLTSILATLRFDGK